MKENKVLDFFIKTLNGMAYGLFATLIVGTIIKTIGTYLFAFENDFCIFFKSFFINSATALTCLTGAAIGIGVANSLKLNSLKVIVLAAAGQIASFFSLSINNIDFFKSDGKFQIGDPLTIYFVVIAVALLLQLILRKATPIDILLVPLLGIILSILITILIRFPLIYVTYAIQYVVDKATLQVPFIMGIVVAIIMGMSLTAPISSTAIAAIVFSGEGEGLALASGAAIVGCCTQMVGFAIQSRKDNNIGMILSIGIGTSMLQFKNILKKPIIWLPTIIASAILGPISTCLFKIKCLGANAGMGTAGGVGIIGSISSSMADSFDVSMFLKIISLEVILPLLLVFIIDLLFRKLNLIQEGDLKV